jgi:hypothetical protein
MLNRGFVEELFQVLMYGRLVPLDFLLLMPAVYSCLGMLRSAQPQVLEGRKPEPPLPSLLHSTLLWARQWSTPNDFQALKPSSVQESCGTHDPLFLSFSHGPCAAESVRSYYRHSSPSLPDVAQYHSAANLHHLLPPRPLPPSSLFVIFSCQKSSLFFA